MTDATANEPRATVRAKRYHGRPERATEVTTPARAFLAVPGATSDQTIPPNATAFALPPDCLPPPEPDPADVVRAVLKSWGVPKATPGRVRGTRRQSQAIRAACIALRSLCPSLTLQEIGDHIGGIHHTTVMYALRAAGTGPVVRS